MFCEELELFIPMSLHTFLPSESILFVLGVDS